MKKQEPVRIIVPALVFYEGGDSGCVINYPLLILFIICDKSVYSS